MEGREGEGEQGDVKGERENDERDRRGKGEYGEGFANVAHTITFFLQQ